ncbi:MAG: hypothetical protein V7K67_10445 [Nostoc sp.]
MRDFFVPSPRLGISIGRLLLFLLAAKMMQQCFDSALLIDLANYAVII